MVSKAVIRSFENVVWFCDNSNEPEVSQWPKDGPPLNAESFDPVTALVFALPPFKTFITPQPPARPLWRWVRTMRKVATSRLSVNLFS